MLYCFNYTIYYFFIFFFSSRRRHTRCYRDWSSDVCSSDLVPLLTESCKLDGPASIEGDTLQLSVYNGTAWNVKEITVGLTILRRSERQTAQRSEERRVGKECRSGGTMCAERKDNNSEEVGI